MFCSSSVQVSEVYWPKVNGTEQYGSHTVHTLSDEPEGLHKVVTMTLNKVSTGQILKINVLLSLEHS